MDFLDKGRKQRNMDMRFGTWNIRSLYRVGSLTTVSRELSRYRLDLVGVQEVRWEDSGTIPAGEYTFFLWKEEYIHTFHFISQVQINGHEHRQ
jgi:exonuclease III